MFTSPLRRFGCKYFLIQKLNSNTNSEQICDIYSVKNIYSEIFILKSYRKGFSEAKLTKTAEIYAHLGKEENPYFLKYISNSKDELIVREKYIVLEFVEKGILKDFLLKAKFFSEKLAKISVENFSRSEPYA